MVDKSRLTVVEKRGRPEEIAAENIRLGSDFFEKSINGHRASQLYSACSRMLVLADGETVYERVSLNQRLTFGIGNSVHEWIQNTDAVFTDEDRYGWWRCLACERLRPFGPRPTSKCPYCGASAKATVYREHSVHSDEPRPCSGHPDLFIKRGDSLRLVEIKTIASEQYKSLIAPLVEHTWQVQFYMDVCASSNMFELPVDPDIGYVLYVSKGHISKGLPVKMFLVLRDQDVITEIHRKLEAYHHGITKNQMPPPISECLERNFTSYKARTCPAFDKCRELG